eukprot:GFUD01068133.1.p1 GENE.GFUD01068133.1~~GFUD01068133.1.p1  ORF type:complete len:182 (-),score=73.18 GFUD01068133.1:318-803(-)
MELGQKGVRYITGMVMEGALRAPGMMAEIVNQGSGQMGLDQRRAQPVYRQASIREVDDTTDNLRPGVADIDMSDDEIGPQSIIPTQEEMELAESDSAEVESTTSSRVVSRRKKKATADLSFSSGAESDDPDFQPAAKGTKSSKPVDRKATARKSTRKPKTQ